MTGDTSVAGRAADPTNAVDPEEDRQSLMEWREFLIDYAAGRHPPDSTPSRPLIPAALLRPLKPEEPPKAWAYANAPLYSTTNITLDDAREIRDYYCEHGYLPPPRSPLESARHACIHEYDLYSSKQLSNIQAATDVIAAFFPDTVCTFSLFHDHIQKHFSLAGDQELIQHYGLEPGLRIPAEDSLCGHAVLHENSIFYVRDLKTDWRYVNNPFVYAGFQSFVGSSVSLRLDPLKAEEGGKRGQRIGVGTLNICFIKQPLHELTPAQRKVVLHVTAMLETQLRATWEGDQRTKEGRARMALSELIEDALVDVKLGADEGREGLRIVTSSALEKLRRVLPELESVALYDTGGVADDTGTFVADLGILCEMVASAGKPLPALQQQAILDTLNAHPSTTVFDSATSAPRSGLEDHFFSSVQSHFILPLRSVSRPHYLIIATSSTPHYAFPPVDVNIIRSVGSVLRARAVQHRVMLADAAKTSFLSSISHELRTPMHGVKASLELIRTSADAKDWEEIEGPLALAESSGRALLNILNDVLDFGKNEWAKVDEGVIDLAKSAEEIVGVCLAHYGEQMGEKGSVRMEWEERDWKVTMNEARYHRIITNGLTNAMKFCSNADILVSLRTASDHRSVILQVEDHGIGIDKDALPRLMQPFTKMDTHSAGAGLGLYITKALVEKMGGELTLRSTKGVGTTFTAVIPVSLSNPDQEAPVRSRYLRSPKQASTPLAASVVNGSGNPNGNGNGANGDDASASRPTTPTPPSHKGKCVTTTPHATPSVPLAIPRIPDDPLHPIRILVIDDNAICRKLLRMAFKRAPMSITTIEADNGQSGLELFEEFLPDLVFTDVSMPIMDGVTAAGRMRGILERNGTGGECKIFALTGLGSSDPRTKSLGVNGKAALDGWLVKGKDMLDTVYKILDDFGDARLERAG